MNIKATFDLSEAERNNTFSYVMENSYPGASFFTLLGASAVIASGGLILNNSAVIIGSMLVAPFLAPIMSLSIGLVVADSTLIRRSFSIIAKASVLVIFISFLTGIVLSVPKEANQEILSRISHSFPFLLVAISAGFAASISLAKKGLRESIVGVAVSVALLPPLATVGIGFASLNMKIASGSLQLFLVNLLGIVFAGMVSFSLMGFKSTKKRIKTEIQKEENKLHKEENADLPKVD